MSDPGADKGPDWIDDLFAAAKGKTEDDQVAMRAVAKITLLHYRGARLEGATAMEALRMTAAFVLAMMVANGQAGS